MTAPEVVRTDRLLLRPFRADDAAALLPVLEANQEHLGSWIPRRISQPAPIPELAQRLAGFAEDFDADREWRYAIFSADTVMLIGEVDLFPRDANGRVPLTQADRAEIGYWLRADMAGQGLATEAAQAMVDVARALPHVGHVEIRCDARNMPSAAVPRRLGFTLAATEARDGYTLQVWTMRFA